MNNHTCVHCGCHLEAGEAYHFQNETYCEDCFEDLTTVCDHCGKRFFREDDEGNDRITLCFRCFTDHYLVCEQCGTIIPCEDACYEDENSDIIYCRSCIEDHTCIHHYNYKPEPVFHGDGDRYFGIELEVDLGGELSANAKKVLEIANASACHAYCKHDGSLDDGFELVTHPQTLGHHLTKMPWRDVLKCLREMGYRSHQTSTAGLHIHVNRDSLGYTWQEQEQTIARILYLVEKFWEELVRFSRRTLSQLDRWAARYGFKDRPNEILKCAKGGYGRYACVNLCPEETIEFRIFRGSLKYNTVIAALELVNQLCSVAFMLSDEEITQLSWSSFVANCTQPELIQYLKERRLYVNDPVQCEMEV